MRLSARLHTVRPSSIHASDLHDKVYEDDSALIDALAAARGVDPYAARIWALKRQKVYFGELADLDDAHADAIAESLDELDVSYDFIAVPSLGRSDLDQGSFTISDEGELRLLAPASPALESLADELLLVTATSAGDRDTIFIATRSDSALWAIDASGHAGRRLAKALVQAGPGARITAEARAYVSRAPRAEYRFASAEQAGAHARLQALIALAILPDHWSPSFSAPHSTYARTETMPAMPAATDLVVTAAPASPDDLDRRSSESWRDRVVWPTVGPAPFLLAAATSVVVGSYFLLGVMLLGRFEGMLASAIFYGAAFWFGAIGMSRV